MKLGIQLPNHTRLLSDLELERLKALRPDLVRAYTYTTREQYQQVIDAVGPVLVILTHLCTGTIDAAAWAQDFWGAARILKVLGLDFWLNSVNEPNHPDGPYPSVGDIQRFKDDWVPLVGELDRVFPGQPQVSPNLAVQHHDLIWASQCKSEFNFCRYIGTNAYWQYENHLSPEWGLRVQQFQQIYPEKEFVVLEMGDATPDAGSVIKCQRMKAVLAAMRGLGYVVAASLFLLGYDQRAPQTWEGFVYRPRDLQALSNTGPTIADLKDLAQRISRVYGLPWDIVDRLIQYESGYHFDAVSPAGAVGLMQLMPRFFPGVDHYDPKSNLEAGCNALQAHLEDFHWDYTKALAAYNWGTSNVLKAENAMGGYWWLALPPETVPYIRRILFGR